MAWFGCVRNLVWPMLVVRRLASDKIEWCDPIENGMVRLQKKLSLAYKGGAKIGKGEGERITGIIRFPPGLLLGKNMKRALASASLPVELSSARGCCLFVVMMLVMMLMTVRLVMIMVRMT